MYKNAAVMFPVPHVFGGIIMKKMKRVTALAAGLVTALSCLNISPAMRMQRNKVSAASGSVIAFPGAVGGGKYATGGRGGEVVHVTNLNDSGEGSFRDAVSKSNRIVVFDVSGTIELKGNILVSSNVTIAGQTAPGGSGITLKNYKLGMSGDNIICRYISSRPGPYASTSSGNDAWGGAKGSNSIIDHCSMGWTTDEQWGLYSNNEYYTVQYSVIGPADSWGGHKKGLHGFGMMMGKGNLSFDHNLIIHNVSRNFRGKVPDQKTADFTNNVIYDWGYQTAYGTIGHLNYVNNTLKMGNSTTGGKHYVYVDSTTKPENFKIYIAGNRILNKDGSVYAGPTYDNWSGVDVKESIGITKNDLVSGTPFQTLVNGENVSSVIAAESAEASYDHVVTYAGNGIAPNKRTAIDRQCAYETINGTGQCSGTSEYDSTVTDLNKYNIMCGVTYNYPDPVLNKEIVDNDNDGMADDWELERGLDPNDPYDYSGDYCGQGYMNIEYYINDLTIDSFPEGVVTRSPISSVPAVPARSAFEPIEAEDFSDQSGITAELNDDGTGNIGFIENGDYVFYKKLAFEDGAKSFHARVSGNPAKLELYLDKISDAPAATLEFTGSSGFTDYKEVSFNIPVIKGNHDLYIRFIGGDGYLMNVDSFVFGREKLPVNGRLISDLKIFDTERESAYSIADGAKVGSLVFGDRDVTFATIPNELVGAEQIVTACDAKYLSGDAMSFYAAKDIKVYVGFDSRVSPTPDWLSAYEKTSLTCSNTGDVTFDLYTVPLKKGERITLGANGQSYMCVNYVVFVVEDETAQPPTEAPTDPPTDAPTELPTEAATEAELMIYGDADGDGGVSINDVVKVLCHTANPRSNPLTDTQRELADVCQNGDGVNVLDAVSIQKFLASMINELPESYL